MKRAGLAAAVLAIAAAAVTVTQLATARTTADAPTACTLGNKSGAIKHVI